MNALRSCELNWFRLVDFIRTKMHGYSKAAIDQLRLDLSGQINILVKIGW